jgi:oligosaccharide repeat unit polymerase
MRQLKQPSVSHLYVRLEDMKAMFRTSSPVFAFIVPWLFAMIGQLLALCELIQPLYSSFYLLIIGNMITILLIGIGMQILYPQKCKLDKGTLSTINLSARFKRTIYYLIGFYLLTQCFQIIYFQGFPLLWLVMGDSKAYVNFGIQSLNGFLNAIYLFSVTSLFIIHLKEKSFKKLILLLLLFSFPILTISRQVLICVSLQIACCYLVYNPKKSLKIFLWGAIIMGLFIIVGNFRTGLIHLINVLQPKPYIPEFLYPFLWIYAYVVTPFNNINASFDQITPVGLPIYELYLLIPTFLRPEIGAEIDTGYNLVHNNMNVSTFYLAPLLDFGRIYSFFLMTLFQYFFVRSYRKAIQTKSPIHLIEYSVLYMITVLSIFNNLLFFLPIIFQLAIINLAKIKFRREKGNLLLKFGKI